MSRDELGPEDEHDAWEITRAFAASSGAVVILVNELPQDGRLPLTPETRAQLADAIGRAAMGHLQRGATTESTRYCKAALFNDRNCQTARACELALLRSAGKRSHVDDIREVATGTRDPFIVALSYSIPLAPEHIEANNRATEAVEHLVTASMLLAGFFYWQALKTHPAFSEPWTNLGASLKELGVRFGASEMSNRAVAINPRDAHAWFNLAIGAWEERRLGDAIASMERADHLGHPLAREALPQIEQQMRSARDEFGGQPQLAQNGIKLFILGDYAGALAVFQRDTRIPADTNRLFYEGHCLRHLGRYEEAASVFQGTRNGDLANLWAAVSFKEAGNLAQAESLASELLRNDPLMIEAHYVLSDTYRLQGDTVQEDLAVRSLFMLDRMGA
jgi:tetratricopeptide (TPR) repeat protein